MYSFFKRHNKKPPTPAPKKDRATVERGLEAIYLDAKGRVPDLGRLDRAVRWSWRRILGYTSMVCLFLVGIACVGLWMFTGRIVQKASALSLALNGPGQILLGQEQTYDLSWHNVEAQPLQDVEVRLNLPLDFTLTKLEPAPHETALRVWKLGVVQPNTSGHIRITGFFIGSLGGDTALQALSTYRDNQGTRTSEETVLRTVHAAGSVVAGNLLFAPRITAGEPTQIRYLVANLGKQPMEGLLARVNFPVGFIPAMAVSSSQVDLANHTATFSIGRLLPDTFYTANLSGLFPSGASGDATFQGEAGHIGIDGAFLTATRSESRVAIAPGNLVVHLVVNGTDSERSIEPGESVRLTLDYQNVSTESVRDMEIRVQAESIVNGRSATGTSLLNWMQLDDASGGTSSTKTRVQTIIYDKTRVLNLGELPPQGQGSIEIGWPSLAVASGTKDALIRLTADVRVSVVGEKTPRMLHTPAITLKYRSDADVSVEPRYFTEEGAPIGLGPLPPVAGTTTTYRIFWHMHKTLHDLNEAKISAILPKIVAWSGNTQAANGAFLYDEATRTVSWVLGRVPEGMNELEGWFDVALTPQMLDVGRFASLLGETSFQFQDARLNESVTRTKPALSTDLSQDEGAKGKGVVRKE